MTHFVEVKLPFNESVTLEYSAQRLITASVQVAEAAMAQEEAAYMSAFFSGQVLNELCGLLLVDGLYLQPLDEYFMKRLGVVRCVHVEGGRADWIFTLKCDECDGSGVTYTVSNKRVPCPDCDETGTMAEAFFMTDMNGRFVGWNADVRCPVMNYGYGDDAVSLVAMDEDKALALVEAWWS